MSAPISEKPEPEPGSKRGFQKGTMLAFHTPYGDQAAVAALGRDKAQAEKPAAAAESQPGAQAGSGIAGQKAPSAAKTMLGIFPGQASGPKAAQAPATAPTEQARPAAPAAPAGPAAGDGVPRGKTMLGIFPGQAPGARAAAPVTAEQAGPPAPAAGQAAADVQARGKTMLGIGLGAMAKPSAQPQAVESAAQPAAAGGEPSSGPLARGHGHDAAASAGGRTMLGVPLAVEPAKPQSAQAAPGAESGRTMLGVGIAEPAAAAAPAAAPQVRAPAYEEDEPAYQPPARAGTGGRVAAVLSTIVFFAVVAGGVYYWFSKVKQPPLKVSVVKTENAEALRFELPGATPGYKVRFGGQEKLLEAGRAEFKLADDALRVGENVAPVDLVHPDGTVEQAKIPLSVPYLIRVDTAPLRADEPAVDVIVNALPGSQVALDGKPLELDPQGRAVRRYPIDAASAPASGLIEHVVRYRIHPTSGGDVVEELRTSIAVSTMQIDRPGLEAVTDKDSVEINGAVAPDSEVTIDGQKVPVSSGRFLHRFPLPAVGEYQAKLVAREPGKAPHARTIHIRRVADLKKEANAFPADPSLTYARIAQNPSIYQGQKVAFEGRVYNVSVQNGQSIIQILVKECPQSTRCSLWVTYPADTDATGNSWVKVLGTLEGQQQFRSENERIVTVPKVAASFVLPLSKDSKAK